MLRRSFIGVCPNLLGRTPSLPAHCVPVQRCCKLKMQKGLKDGDEEHLKRLSSTPSFNYINQRDSCLKTVLVKKPLFI